MRVVFIASISLIFGFSTIIMWGAEAGLDIEDPPGMESVVSHENGITHIRFVPKDPSARRGAVSTIDTSTGTPASNASPAPSPKKVTVADIADKLSSLNLDRPISAVPAFVALDVSPETVSTPQSPRDLIASLLNGVDRNGIVQHGVAIETAPFRMLPFVRTDIDAYSKNYLTQLLYNFGLSIATSKASDNSDAVQLALGFNAIVFETKNHDARRNEKLTEAFKNVNWRYRMTPVSPETPIMNVPDENPAVKKTMQEAVDEFRKKSWEGAIWSVGAAPTWNSDSGKISELSGTGFSAWTTFAYGFSEALFGDSIRLQLLGHLRYREGEHVVDPNDSMHTANQNSFIAAVRARLGAPDFNGFVETGYVRITHGLEGNGDGWRTAAGIEKKISENLWFVLSAGEQFGMASTKVNELFAVGSIRFGSADKPQLEPK